MEVYSPQLDLRDAWIGDRQLDVASSSSAHRYKLALPVVALVRQGSERLDLTLVDRHGSQTRAKVSLGHSRRLQIHGWEPIGLNRDGDTASSGSERAYRVLHDDRDVIVVLSMPPASDFMADLSDSLALGDLTLPGTHESCALYGGPISQCQQSATVLLRQLEDGIRFLDIRLKVIGDQLLVYHGPQSQHYDFQSILQVIHLFLRAHPAETLIMSVKEEIPPFHPLFSAMVERDLTAYREDWILGNRVPTLGEARGKAILFSRFEKVQEKEWPEGMGMHPGPWPDSKPWVFEWNCAGTKVRVQDWYRVGSFLQIPEKLNIIIDSLQPCAREKLSSQAPFTLSFTTASGFPLGLPTFIAKGFGWPSWGLGVRGINSRLCEWLLQRISEGKQVRACLPMDFYRQTGEVDEDLSAILVGMNFL